MRRGVLNVNDAFHLAAVDLKIVVVIIGSDIHSAPTERKKSIIEVEQIRIVLVDEVARAVVEVLNVGNVRKRVGGMLWPVELLRVETLPPLIVPVGFREAAVVRNTGQWTGSISAVARLKPPPVASLVHGYAEAKITLACLGRPRPDHIPMRAEVDRIPRMMFRIPGVKTIVMIGHRHEKLGARAHVQVHQLRRVPIQSRPLGAEVFVAETGRRPVVSKLKAILPTRKSAIPELQLLQVHIACVPIAVFGNTLRTPVVPDPELRVSIPFRTFVLKQRFPRWLVWPFASQIWNRRKQRYAAPRAASHGQCVARVVRSILAHQHLRAVFGRGPPTIIIQTLGDDSAVAHRVKDTFCCWSRAELSVILSVAAKVQSRGLRGRRMTRHRSTGQRPKRRGGADATQHVKKFSSDHLKNAPYLFFNDIEQIGGKRLEACFLLALEGRITPSR